MSQTNTWMFKEYRVLIDRYPIDGLVVLEQLSNRTKSSVLSKANSLGVSFRAPLTQQELTIMQNYGGVLGEAVYLLLPDRTLEEVRWLLEEDRFRTFNQRDAIKRVQQ